MAWCSRACSSKSSRQNTRNNENIALLQKYNRFQQSELLSFKHRFQKISQDGGLTCETFMENMGLLGLESTRLIADRIFAVMNSSGSGRVSLEEYLDYNDVLMNGTQTERAEQSFKLITMRKSNDITFDDFATWLIEIGKLYNALTGSEVSTSEQELRQYFQSIDKGGDGKIDLEEYIQGMKENKNLFEWFDFVNKGISDQFNPGKFEESEPYKSTYIGSLDSLKDELRKIVQILANREPNSPISNKSLPGHARINSSGNRKASCSSSRPPEIMPVNSESAKSDLHSKDEIDIRQILLSLREPDPFDDTHLISNCPLLGTRHNTSPHLLRVSSNKTSASKKEEETIEHTIQRLENILRSIRSLKAAVLNEFKEGSDEEEEGMSPTLLRVNTQANVPKPHEQNVIHWGDEDWNLILNMMLGIQKSVRSASVSPDAEGPVTDHMFTLKEKLNLLPDQQRFSRKNYKFRSYAPAIFERIRRFYGITANDYIKSLGIETIMRSLMIGEFSSLIGLYSSGKSGSFFYYSLDGKYMIKTMSRDEYLFFKRDLLANYYFHIMKNPNTLITRFFGFHKIIYNRRGNGVYFVVMGNVFNNNFEIHSRYDLKGSTYKRFTDPNADRTVARKDLDFNNSEKKLYVGLERKEALMRQIEKDCDLFMALNIIDYSLLAGLHRLSSPLVVEKHNGLVPLAESDNGGLLSTDGNILYFIGIIDILTKYSSKKKLEHAFKKRFQGDQISCIPPKQYAERFMNYMNSILE